MTLPLADELLAELSAPDRHAAAAFCLTQVEAGLAMRDLVDGVLAPAMAQVGLLWQSALWSVVDEHIATGVAETALSAAAAFDRPGPTRGEIVVACVEGDWHSLPARMVAEVLDNEGWSVRFLGASQPAAMLSEYVRRHRPDAVLLSCAIPMALPALLEAVRQLRQFSPVYVGGRALGDTPRRAAALGADGWAPDAGGAGSLLEQPRRPEPPADALARLPRYHDVRAVLPTWTGQAMTELATLMPAVASYSHEVWERTEADLYHILDIAAIAELLDDDTLVVEQISWLADILAARNVPGDALRHGLDALMTTHPDAAGFQSLRPRLSSAHDVAKAWKPSGARISPTR